MTQVKICGLTCEEDSRAAVEAGADAIGVDFRPGSPHRVDTPRARAIGAAAGADVERVGVFANAEPSRLLSSLSEAALDVAQLQGDEDAAYGRSLGRAWYRVFRIDAGSEPAALFDQIRECGREVFMLLLGSDPATPGADRARALRLATKVSMRASLAGGWRMILAGGLEPGNVAEAVRLARPWRVDVCRGVEASVGRKDPVKMAEFIAAVRGVA